MSESESEPINGPQMNTDFADKNKTIESSRGIMSEVTGRGDYEQRRE